MIRGAERALRSYPQLFTNLKVASFSIGLSPRTMQDLGSV